MGKKLSEAETYRSLRTRIQLGYPEDKIISIISNDSGDGKTNTAFKLAESFAKSGKKTLLIDGNLRNPDLSRKIANDKSKGLANLLKGNGVLGNILVKCEQDNLYILPTEESSHDSTELLESNIILSIFENVRKDFDYVIIDTLSLNEGMDGLILSKISDGVIYIAVENKTKAKMIEEYRIMIDEANIKLIGAIWKH